MKTSFAFLITLVFLTASCGERAVNPPEDPALDGISFRLGRDVRDNLVRHYAMAAAKPPVGNEIQRIQFDFLETSRAYSSEDEGVISGEFLFAVDTQPLKRGTIDIFFWAKNGAWSRTGVYRVEEAPVSSHVLTAVVRSGVSEKPLARAAVLATRVNGGNRCSRLALTDEGGRAQVEVLSGTFHISVEHPEYRSTTLADISTAQSQQVIAEISLIPRGGGIRTSRKWPEP